MPQEETDWGCLVLIVVIIVCVTAYEIAKLLVKD